MPLWGTNTIDPLIIDTDLVIQGSVGVPGDLIFSNAFGGGDIRLSANPTTAANIIELPNQSGDVTITGNGADPPTLAQKLGKVNRTGLIANIPTAVKLTNGAPAGRYQVSVYMACTTAGAGTVNFLLNYNDGAARTGVPCGSQQMTATNASPGTQTKEVYLASGDITWNTSGYVSGAHTLRVAISYKGP